MAIFFPAQVGGRSHAVVKHGEAFVLVPNEHDLSEEEINDISRTFNILVDTSHYGPDEVLCRIGSIESIDEEVNVNEVLL